jgi:hypothetical protein
VIVLLINSQCPANVKMEKIKNEKLLSFMPGFGGFFVIKLWENL